MIPFALTVTAVIIAYFLGSIPTALIVSKRIKRIDIRNIGDGNMGARNTFREIGPKFGVTVAVLDFTKGALAVYLAYILGLSLGWQILVGMVAIVGHDFPVFANFKGGQGLATSLGTMVVLFPLPTIIGLVAYGMVFSIIRNSNISVGICCAGIVLMLIFSHEWLLSSYAVAVFVSIPLKLFLDNHRRMTIRVARQR